MANQPPLDIFPDDSFWDFHPEDLPEGFFSDDATESDLDWTLGMRNQMGRNFDELFAPIDKLIGEGRGNQLRAVRFGSGYEAFRWLIRRALFIYSRIVWFPDGTWGVAIGETPTIDAGEIEDDSIVF